MDGLTVGTTSLVGQPDAMSEALDSQLKFTESGGSGWWIASGTTNEYYYEADAVQSDYDLPDTGGETCLQAIVDSDSSQTVKFYWKVSSEQSHDYLQFYIDSTLKDQISGEVAWQQKSYSVTSGIHILKWRYVKDGSGKAGDDCGWVDFVQWTGPSPAQDPSNWQEIDYKHDVHGRRVEKKVDGYSTRYCYDAAQVIAEYDGNNNLLRKYIYGPGIDQPVSMIEVADANATYYYHFDALGSVVALSDASGDTVQTYEYSVYGEVAVQDPNHTNPYMFAGVRYDIEIGLYYNRARYYNPFTGRFLQTDPIGYGDGINWYTYCGNNPLNYTDALGTHSYSVLWGDDGFTMILFDDNGQEVDRKHGTDPCDYYNTMMYDWGEHFGDEWKSQQAAGGLWENSGSDNRMFWEIQLLIDMCIFSSDEIRDLGALGVQIAYIDSTGKSTNQSYYNASENTVYWDPFMGDLTPNPRNWQKGIAIAHLAHELDHAYMYYQDREHYSDDYTREKRAVSRENKVRARAAESFSNYGDLYPRFHWRAYDYALPGDASLWWWFYNQTQYFSL